MVTGAGSGIGRALSVLLASKGLHVLAVGRRPKADGVASEVEGVVSISSPKEAEAESKEF